MYKNAISRNYTRIFTQNVLKFYFQRLCCATTNSAVMSQFHSLFIHTENTIIKSKIFSFLMEHSTILSSFVNWDRCFKVIYLMKQVFLNNCKGKEMTLRLQTHKRSDTNDNPLHNRARIRTPESMWKS